MTVAVNARTTATNGALERVAIVDRRILGNTRDGGHAWHREASQSGAYWEISQ
jgi:hypothetical protein